MLELRDNAHTREHFFLAFLNAPDFADLLIGVLNLYLQEVIARLLMLNLTSHPPPAHRDKENCAPRNKANQR
jgi:hypothetical protein